MVSARPAALAVLAFAASGLLVHGEAVDGASVGADPTTNITTTTITTVTATTKQPVTPTSTSSASSSPTTTSSTPYEVPLRTGVLAGALSGSLIVVFGIVIFYLLQGRRARLARAARQVNDLSSTLLDGYDDGEADSGMHDGSTDEELVIFARGSGNGIANGEAFPNKFSTGGPGGAATSELGALRRPGLPDAKSAGAAAAGWNSSMNNPGFVEHGAAAEAAAATATATATATASAQKSDAQLATLQHETALLQNRLRETEQKRQQMDSHITELSQRLRDADSTKSHAQSDLAIERQWRQNLVREIEEERAKLDALTSVDDELKETKERYAQLMEEHMKLRANYVQQEQSLVEMGSLVAEEKLRGNEMAELKRAETKQTWVDSATVTHCTACRKEFGILTRKHHCRRCGQIFCDDCSSRKAALASSPEKVRVCDKCFGIVGQTSLGEPVLLGGWAD